MKISDMFLEITHCSDRTGMQVSKTVVEQIMLREIRKVGAMFPRTASQDITTDANGEFEIGSLTNPGRVVEVYCEGKRLSPCLDPDRQERMS